MNKRWIISAMLFALAAFPLLTAQPARADRDDHHHGHERWEHHGDRDHHWDRDHHYRYYHRDWDDYYRGPIYDNGWGIHFRVNPDYRYYDDYYDYRDYYAQPWWNGGSFGLYYRH